MSDEERATDAAQKQLSERSEDKAWIRSSEGREAMAEARRQAAAAIRQLESSQPILSKLVKRRFV